ncbi:hypothetical protein GIB67_033433, partial [Kingdonia uniflora]
RHFLLPNPSKKKNQQNQRSLSIATKTLYSLESCALIVSLSQQRYAFEYLIWRHVIIDSTTFINLFFIQSPDHLTHRNKFDCEIFLPPYCEICTNPSFSSTSPSFYKIRFSSCSNFTLIKRNFCKDHVAVAMNPSKRYPNTELALLC